MALDTVSLRITTSIQPTTIVKTNHRLILRERIARYAELTGKPIVGPGSIYYGPGDGFPGVTLHYRNDHGGINTIRRFDDYPQAVAYLDGCISALTSAKESRVLPRHAGSARVHVNCSPRLVGTQVVISIDNDYYCFDTEHDDNRFDVLEKIFDSALDNGSIHSYYIERPGTTVTISQ